MAITKSITMTFRMDHFQLDLAAAGPGKYTLSVTKLGLSEPAPEFEVLLEEADVTVFGEGVLDFISMVTDKR